MTRSIKTDNPKIHIQIIENKDKSEKLIMMRINEGCWQEVILPNEIVKDKFTDAKFWTHLINFFIKD